MKKIFSLFTAALLSASMFAARDVVPNPSDLSAFSPETKVVLCAYFDGEVCNDIILMGDYNGWDAASQATVKMREVEGFDGWYAGGVDPDPEGKDKKFKPVQLKSDGSFSWDFQCGGPSVWVKANPAGGDLDIQSEMDGAECGMHYTEAGAYIYYCTAWKAGASPCKANKDYFIKVYAPECEWVEPTIAGGFDSWADVNHAMEFDFDEQERMYYYYELPDQTPGVAIKIKGGEGWGNPIQHYVDSLSDWRDIWPGTENAILGDDSLIIFDWSDSLHRWQSCEEPIECDSADYTFTVTFPACDSVKAPAIIGDFNGWSNTVMTATANPNEYTVTVKALCTDKYKFRDSGYTDWANQVQKYNFESGKWDDLSDAKFGEETTITLDYSGADYKWTLCEAPAPTAVATVKAAKPAAKKVLVNGQMVIDVEGAKYNVLGVEMK